MFMLIARLMAQLFSLVVAVLGMGIGMVWIIMPGHRFAGWLYFIFSIPVFIGLFQKGLEARRMWAPTNIDKSLSTAQCLASPKS